MLVLSNKLLVILLALSIKSEPGKDFFSFFFEKFC